MLKVFEKLDQPRAASRTLTLPFELRQKSRLRATLDNGEDIGLMLPRGLILRGGDCVRAEDDTVIRIIAAPENVSTVQHADLLLLTRAAYHLGNRHVALQVGAGWLRYQHDHVLDDMVRGLGLNVLHELAEFEPESGAYGDHGSHAHGHDHGHHHEHSHTHNHNHTPAHNFKVVRIESR
jgi:urease accessory protein